MTQNNDNSPATAIAAEQQERHEDGDEEVHSSSDRESGNKGSASPSDGQSESGDAKAAKEAKRIADAKDVANAEAKRLADAKAAEESQKLPWVAIGLKLGLEIDMQASISVYDLWC